MCGDLLPRQFEMLRRQMPQQLHGLEVWLHGRGLLQQQHEHL